MSDPIVPTVGRIVYYVTNFVDSEETASRAAIITAVEPDNEAEEVSLCIFHTHGVEHASKIPHDEGEKPIRTWHWPPRS